MADGWLKLVQVITKILNSRERAYGVNQLYFNEIFSVVYESREDWYFE